jgi:hypothetical protein
MQEPSRKKTNRELCQYMLLALSRQLGHGLNAGLVRRCPRTTALAAFQNTALGASCESHSAADRLKNAAAAFRLPRHVVYSDTRVHAW